MLDATQTMPLTPEELNKLTVPQLKTICKEKNITGYSKLSKDRIIQKLIHTIPCKNSEPLAVLTPPPIPKHSPTLEDNGQSCEEAGHNPTDSRTSRSNLHPHRSTFPAVTETTLAQLSAPHLCPPRPPLKSTSTNETTMLSRSRRPPCSVMLSGPSKKRKVEPAPMTKERLEIGGEQSPIFVPPCQPVSSNLKTRIDSINEDRPGGPPTRAPNLTSTMRHKLHVPKRFVPLEIKHISSPSPAKAPINIPTDAAVQDSGERLSIYHLDFPSAVPIDLTPITFPPSLSQRKWVSQLSILLGGITAQELYVCSLVSRSLRYAAYLSAVSILARSFSGRRLNEQFQKYRTTMTNMWPYLQQRELELRSRRRLFSCSFLGRLVKGNCAIAEHLWSSPDHEHQIVIALRCLLSQMFFSISVGSSVTSFSTYGKILDVQQVANSEIWKITWSKSLGTPLETKFVLEQTGEVIGHGSHGSGSQEGSGGDSLRADWSAFISKRLDEPLNQHPTILSYLDWTNKEEYEYGISKQWLKNIKADGHVGEVKKILARRYVLACVVGNSISGRCMSSTEMAQEFNGNTSNIAIVPQKTPRVHLFLPCHHHVESVHFTSSNGVALHPALAVVQTPGREYYILRDNGMQVGCEEDGVAAVWMRVLGCSQLGI
ncbi:hypothetical protein BD779DRAFT_1499503 [Infundibulicybe gibba]|nr:hypothetical protein BD779DRAFT_1499503 [Infundibulicybe gibba]